MSTATIPFPYPPPSRKLLGRDVPLEDGRVLRCGVLYRNDEPEELILATGTGEGKAWREDPAEGLVLPASCIEQLWQTLEVLELRRRVPNVETYAGGEDEPANP